MIREESEAETETKEVDDSDVVAVLGRNRSLMYFVRKFGIECLRKNLKNANTIEKYYATYV
ncbi:hypothetical protein V8B55DRAFT_1469018, partial [Mucor lusitanicus]